MKKFLMLALALVALGTIATFGLAQEPREIRINPAQSPPLIPSLTCCECLGKVITLNLNTGQLSPKDPIWSVNGNFAYTTPKVSSWISLPPAQWIQPVASPTPSTNIPVGVYKYTVKFNIPECTIHSQIQLTGTFSADNSATAFLDTVAHPVGSCGGPTCFLGNAPLTAMNPAWLKPGPHTLEIDVTNTSIYSGLIVNAKLTRQCARGNPGPVETQTMEPND